MYVVVVFLEANRQHAASLRGALLMHARNCLEKETGCRTYEVSADPVEPGAFLLYQVYETEAAFAAHKEMAHFAEFRLKVERWIETRRILTYELLAGAGVA